MDLIKKFFDMNLNIKLYHWQTKIYSRHKASDELHSKILELIDLFVEVYIGKYSRESINSTVDFDIHVSQFTGGNNEHDAVKLLEGYVSFLVSLQFNSSDTDLSNIRDEMLAVFNQTLYLFTLN